MTLVLVFLGGAICAMAGFVGVLLWVTRERSE